jgi:hypothetical protein
MVIGRVRGREHPEPTFCNTTKGKNAGKNRTCAEHTSDSRHFRSKGLTRAQNILLVPVTNVTSGHVTDVTSGSTPAQHPRNDDLSCSHILLSLCLLTPQ